MIGDNVLQVSAVYRGITNAGKPYQRREVVLEDKMSNATIKVKLWDQRTELNLQEGRVVTMRNVITNLYDNKHLSVQSTCTTKILVCAMSIYFMMQVNGAVSNSVFPKKTGLAWQLYISHAAVESCYFNFCTINVANNCTD